MHSCLARATLTQTGAAGANAFLLPARIGRLKLIPGSYVLLATPVSAGRTGNQQTTTLRIAR
jgi:hypothetical protein